MKNLIKFLTLIGILNMAGAAHAQIVANGSFTSGAASYSTFFGLNGHSPNPANIANWTKYGAATLYTGVEGAATSLNPKNTFGPADYGGNTFCVLQSSTGTSQLYQGITLPNGNYQIQYSVACPAGTPTWQVVVQSGGANIYIRSGTASSSSFVSYTDYFAGGGGSTPTIFLQNYSSAAYLNYANVSITSAQTPAPTVGNNGPICQGGTIILQASSPYTSDPSKFTWHGGILEGVTGNSLSFGGASPSWSGTYTCTVNLNGNISPAASTTVTINPTSVGGTAAATASTVCSGSDTTITLSGYTGSIQWYYSTNGWATAYPLGTSPSFNTGPITQKTWYVANVTSGVCSVSQSSQAIVDVSPAPVGGTATATAATLCGGSGTTITLSGYAGAIQWYSSTNGSSYDSVSGATTATLPTGNLTRNMWYRATVTSGGCASANSSVTTVTLNAPPTVGVNSAVICAGGSTLLTASTGASNPGYLWSPGGETTPSITVSPASTTVYTVTVTDGTTSCTNSGSGTVTVNAQPVLTTDTTNQIACAGSTVTWSVAATGAGLSYQWQRDGTNLLEGVSNFTGTTTATLTNSAVALTDGMAAAQGYACVISNAPCSNITSTPAALTVNPLPSASVNSAAICAGGSATLTATTDASNPNFLWSPGGATTASITVSPSATTTYTVTVSDGAASCANSASGLVTVSPLPTASVNSATICAGGSAMLTATTDASNPGYLWSPGGATTVTITVSPASTTLYTVTVTDGTTSCTNSGSGTVTVNPLPLVTVDTTNQTACVGSPATWWVAATGTGLTYQWQRDGTNLLEGVDNFTGTTTPTLANSAAAPRDSVDAAHGYACVISNGTCTAISTRASLIVNPPPSVSVMNWAICAGGSAMLTATTDAGNPTYLWSPGGETTASITVSPTSTTNYTVTVTDGATGCTNSASGTVTVNPLPIVSVNSAAVCAGGSVLLTATSDANIPLYLWSPGGETTASITVAPSSTTIYTVTVTDVATSCYNSGSGTVTINALPTANAGASRAICSGSPAGIGGSPTAGGGTGPYTYHWAPSTGLSDAAAANPTATITNPATYTVTVTDYNGCTASNSIVLTLVPPPETTSITMSGTDATLVWNSLAGQTYRVQYQTDLNDTGWKDVTGDVLAAGSTASKTVPVGDAAQRFYRVSVVCP